jgi:hypothetical protein
MILNVSCANSFNAKKLWHGSGHTLSGSGRETTIPPSLLGRRPRSVQIRS